MIFKKMASCICTNIGDQAIILNIKNGHYYELNKTALAIWNQLDTNTNAESIASALSQIYQIEQKTIKIDIENFLNRCLENGFLQTE